MLGGLFGGGSEEQETEGTPWRFAEPILKSHARMIHQPKKWKMYKGELMPDINEYQRREADDATSFVDEYGGMGGGLMDAGMGMVDRGYGGAMDHYGNVLGQGPVQMQDTQGILQNAAMYADNPYLSGQIDAVNRDVSRNLYEQQLPGIAAASAGSGNLGSSRRGMLEGIALRGAADRMADNAASMRGSAYNQGLSYANQIAQQNANLNMQNRNMQMNAANQMAGAGAQGANMIGAGQNLFSGQNQMMGGLGQQYYDRAQQGLSMAEKQHYLKQQLPYMQANMGLQTMMPAATAFGTTYGTAPAANPMMQLAGMGTQLGVASMMG